VLNLLILVGTVAFFAAPGAPGKNWVDLLWAFVLAGALISVFSVAVGYYWGIHAAEPLLAVSLPMLHAAYLVLRPLVSPLRFIDPLVRRLLGVSRMTPDDASEIEQEILDVVTEGEMTGLVDRQQKHMIEAVVEFGDTTVDEVMKPRTEVEGIEVSTCLDDVIRFAREAGHSRFPVYEDNLDRIVGVLYVKDLLDRLGADTQHPFDLRQVVRDAVFVPESKTLRDLLAEMQQEKVHMALVLDEYGGTAGLVTIEDILEELAGEIQDAYEPENEPEPTITRIDDRTAEADGRVYVDDLNEELHVEIPEDEDYDTVGGFVFSTLGHIPEPGETFDHENLRVTVLEAEKTRVNRIRVEVLNRPVNNAAAAAPDAQGK
jgi:CBS domain containing-hemolysin-like protein